MSQFESTREYLRLVPMLLMAFAMLAIGDWLLLEHQLLNNFSFVQKLSLHTALLSLMSSLILLLSGKSPAKLLLPLVGLAYCGLLSIDDVQEAMALGSASPGTLFAFVMLFVGVIANQYLKIKKLRFLLFAIFTGVQTVGVIGVSQYILQVEDLGNQGFFTMLSPATSVIVLLLAPLLFMQSGFRILDFQSERNHARDNLALALFLLPIAISLLCVVPVLFPQLGKNPGDLLLLLLALSSTLGCAFLYYFGTYAGEKEEEVSLKLKAQALALDHAHHRSLQAALDVAEEQKRFSSVLAHEIRTPLSTLLGLIKLLRIRKSKEIVELGCDQEFIQIESSAKLLREMVNSVLDYAKLKSGQLVLASETTEPKAVANDLINLYKPTADRKQIDIGFELSPDVPPFVMLDRIRLREILSNLLDNALKFTNDHGSVKLKIELCDENPNFMKFLVLDTGIGIAPEQVDRVFQPFRQASEGISRQFGGTGLGLSYSKELADFMDGALNVRSELGKGTEMELLLPLVAASAPVEGAKAKKPVRKPLNLKVLMVEDHKLNAEIHMMILKSMGVVADWVDSAEAALEKFQAANQYDAVLMDINLGAGMSGIDCALELKTRFGVDQPPVFAMTAGTMDDQVESIRQAGMKGIIPKPFELEAAYAALSELSSA